MNFIDSSTFLYAFLIPRGELPIDLMEKKKHSKAIITRIQEGEPVMTSASHISEIANILESRFSLQVARSVVSQIILSESITISEVDRLRYEAALNVSERHDLGINDSVAYTLMLESGVEGIYSFDSDFDRLPRIRRLTK